MLSITGLNEKTGLLTQITFEAILEYEVNRIQRYPAPITVLRFKILSEDQLPQSLKDKVQWAIAETLKIHLRQSDIAGHYESDFMAILPHTEIAPGQQVARRVLDHLNEHLSEPIDESFDAKVCVGITHFHKELSLTSKMLIRHVDRMLDCVELTGKTETD